MDKRLLVSDTLYVFLIKESNLLNFSFNQIFLSPLLLNYGIVIEAHAAHTASYINRDFIINI